MILPAALPEECFFDVLVYLRVVNAASCRSVFSRGPWLVGVVFGPLLDIWNLFLSIMLGTAAIRTIARRVEHVGNRQNYQLRGGICCQVQTSFSTYQWMLLYERARSHVLLVVVKHDQLSSEIRNVRACFFYDVTTRMLFLCAGTSERVFMMLRRESLVLCLARQLSTDLESPEISCRQMNSWSHILVCP